MSVSGRTETVLALAIIAVAIFPLSTAVTVLVAAVPVATAVNVSLFALAVMTVAIRAFNDASRALGVMAAAVTVAVFGRCLRNEKSCDNGQESQYDQVALHIKNCGLVED